MLNNENAAPSNMAKATGGKKSKEKTIEETYTKKTQLEHILIRPDTYIGSIEKQTQQMWVYDVARYTFLLILFIILNLYLFIH